MTDGGMADSHAFIDECIRQGKQVDFFVIPGHDKYDGKGKGSSL
jgi:hypothetical protein